ncbi:MAG: cadmium-translocating P-type ATPase [Chloroflexi bacterium]|nr:cadmium-translocating P-type ATPase [Chloroflexota bacterium]MBU1749025.1 cadmium-translocating P-type ATPase [Chloroflexota bacterium]
MHEARLVDDAITFRLAGLDCADCAEKVERAVAGLPGVTEARVNFGAATLAVTPAQDANMDDLRARVMAQVHAAGYDAVPADSAQVQPPPGLWAFIAGNRRARWTLVAGVLLLAGFALAAGHRFVLAASDTPALELAANLCFVAATVFSGYHVARAGLSVLRATRAPDMNILMSVAAAGAILIGEPAEAATAMVLFGVGNALEAFTMDRARQGIRRLMDLSPRQASRVEGDGEERVPVEALAPGDVVRVRPGERIPADGMVLAGESAVDQAPITGESVPADKAPDDAVYAGTINGHGLLDIRVTKRAQDTTLARLIHLVEEAQAQRAPSQRWVDTFARRYTPAVMLGAVLVALIPPFLLGGDPLEWVRRALVLLVIACPCALVISTPVSIVAAIGAAARRGVLFKGGAHLEATGRIRAVAFDKTGTLTVGRPAVTDIVPLNGRTAEEVLTLAAEVESGSEHPLARAVVDEARRRGLTVVPAASFQALAGRGAQARVNGHRILVGSHALFEEALPHDAAICRHLEALEAQGKTAMLVGHAEDCADGPPEVVGLIALADTVRPEAHRAVAALKAAGVQHTILLTGDNARTAQAIAAQAGVDEARANLLPADKVTAIEALLARYDQVAMVGDGVNDAPALARATVGITLGTAGTDVALETADVALMGDDLTRLPFAIRLSRATRRIIVQNIALSLVIKALFLALGLFGLATLWMAVFADMGASLIVTLNGMRLLRFDGASEADHPVCEDGTCPLD